MNATEPSPDASWLNPSAEQQGLARTVSRLGGGRGLILFTVLITTLASVAYVVTASKVYEAEADLLITPIDNNDPTLSGLGLISSSSDPTRDVETASKLVRSTTVAKRVKTKLHDSRSAEQLLEKVSVAPVATSNIVAVTAEGGSPKQAQALANAFAQESVANRTENFHTQIDKRIANISPQVNGTGSATERADPNSLASQLTRLKLLRSSDDPTIRVETLADPPSSASSPKKKLSVIAGVVAGLVLGIGGAFALQVLDPRLRREEQLRRLYGLPILARIPKDARAHGAGALAPESLSPSTIEAYRTLRATLAASRGHEAGSTSILV